MAKGTFVSLLIWTAVVSLGSAAGCAAEGPARDEPTSVLPNLNKLTPEEKAAGWQLLFDGKTTAGWSNFHKLDISKGWKVIDGALCRVDESAGDIVTAGKYGNFVLELDYKVPANSNSGIMYRISDDYKRIWMSGVEYQILDNANPNGGSQKAGWAYGLYAPAIDPKTGQQLDTTKPVGRWNHVKLICNGPHVEHWMNGVKYLEYEAGSEDFKHRVAGHEPYNKYPKFGTYPSGRIGLQGDHGNVSFANIKLRPLPEK